MDGRQRPREAAKRRMRSGRAVKDISKILFGLEAVVLAYVTLLFCRIHRQRLTWHDVASVVTVTMICLGLVSDWRLAIAFLFRDRRSVRKLWRGWWYLSFVVAAASLIVALLDLWPAMDGARNSAAEFRRRYSWFWSPICTFLRPSRRGGMVACFLTLALERTCQPVC
jgi:hypothetical protein